MSQECWPLTGLAALPDLAAPEMHPAAWCGQDCQAESPIPAKIYILPSLGPPLWAPALPAFPWVCREPLWALQVWTYNKRAAFVVSVTEKGRPVLDNIKLQRLRQILFNLVDNHDDGIINIKHVSSPCWPCNKPGNA